MVENQASLAVKKVDPRRVRTRAALVSAAQTLLTEKRTDVSVLEITQLAGIGQGSFYNHFESKDALFTEAVESALDAWGLLRDEIVAGLDDPAEIFATSFRMSGRLQRESPELVRVFLNSGISILLRDRGLRPRALADIQRGIDSGRFDVPSAEIGLMAVGGALLGLLQLLDSDASLDDAQVSDAFAERALLILGITRDEATRIVGLDLPAVPDLLEGARRATWSSSSPPPG